MIITKTQGEKLSDKYMDKVYGAFGCGGVCGDCDCRSSGGANFFGAFDSSMTNYTNVLEN